MAHNASNNYYLALYKKKILILSPGWPPNSWQSSRFVGLLSDGIIGMNYYDQTGFIYLCHMMEG